MGKWEIYSFDEVIFDDTKNGTKIKNGNYLENGLYPIIDQGQNLVAGYWNKNDGLYSDVPAIIFGDHTRIIKYIDTPFFLGADGVKLLKSKKDNMSYKYLYYFFLRNEVPNTGYNRHFKWLKELAIPLPPLEIQKQIAKTLDTAAELLAMRKQQLTELDNLIKSTFYDMFGDPVTNEKGWETGTIRDIVIEVKYGTSRPATENGKYIYLRMNNITYDGQMNYSSIKYIDMPEDEIEKYIVRKGDVLFNRTNSKELVGKTAVFKDDMPMIIAGYIIRLKVNEKADPEFLSAILNSRYGKATLLGMCKAIVGQANINAQELQNINIFIPPIKLQACFVSIINKIDEQKVLVQQSINETQHLFDSLMSKYFE